MSLRSLQPKQNQCKERKLFLLFRPQKAFEASWARRRPGGEFFCFCCCYCCSCCCCFLRVFRRRTRNCVDSWLCGRTGARRSSRRCSTRHMEGRQHRLDTSQKIVSSLAKLPVHAPSKAPAGWPPTLTIPPYLCFIYYMYAMYLCPSSASTRTADYRYVLRL